MSQEITSSKFTSQFAYGVLPPTHATKGGCSAPYEYSIESRWLKNRKVSLRFLQKI